MHYHSQHLTNMTYVSPYKPKNINSALCHRSTFISASRN